MEVIDASPQSSAKTRLLVAAVIALAFLYACEQNQGARDSSDKQSLGTALPSAIRTSTLPDSSLLRAFLEVNGERRAMTINGNTAEAKIPSLPAGSSTVIIEFEYQSQQFGDISLATASRTLDLQPGGNRVEFVEADYQFPDADTDSHTNLAEINNGTNPSDRSDPPKQWGMAGPIETDDAGNAERVQLAVNPDGNALAIWQQSNGTVLDVWSNHLDAETGWGTAVRLESDDGGDARIPAVGIDANGNGIAVWQQNIPGNGGTRIWASRFDASAGWEPAFRFEPSVTGFSADPQVAMNESGTAMAVWTQKNSGDIGFSVWANRFDAASGWSTPELLENNTTDNARSPQIAIDVNGNALAVWRQLVFDAEGVLGTEGNLWSNLYIADTGWSNPERVETLGGNSTTGLDVAMDNDGNGMAVWVQVFNDRETIRANRFDSVTGVWEGVKLIQSPSVGASPAARRPDVAFDESGKALAVWQQNDGTRANIYANGFDPVIGWGDATLIEDLNTTPINTTPRTLAFGGAGEAMAVWRQHDGTRYNIWSNRFDPASGWGKAVLAEDTNAGDAIDA